ncbi:3-methyl-2-oxobutanoate dehydrogenase subunit VorB [Oceanidesulfovibrio marinus]|uniref:3-methyl-2-oxobutanoate dehydrogenase subunit VorB n=1 Tax=Oceanidesulfovibrio marinus TaxID=370038 RepID=A0A6P1ZGF4_9BACT|nr:3-methyl-2-oxobutanoate dehydrogenase subunit VorB [Oceanidesulfovibrio marinus]QJT09515.1 3-methyl-2-oxobutanoate dehydrogenase subunit VorB [Oceanidesulfovibrio marinus]TVM33725.1 3-methyl-2-oxobutanoate dehydrogenase subunit beta [Oceanidesulfovibrio marinus]
MPRQLMKGNDALSEAAVRAGCRFFGGYPITPQSEIPEYLSWRMPEVGGTFIQAESELSGVNMVYGAAAAGFRAMTSSSGPGFSLLQEGISYIASAELPAVFIDVQRYGSGLGDIFQAQGDYWQATRGGGHGDYRMLVYAPASVQESVDLVSVAFDKADQYRNPTLILSDASIAQMMEPVTLPEMKEHDPNADWAVRGKHGKPFKRVTSTMYYIEDFDAYIKNKYDEMADAEQRWESIKVDDAELVLVAYGISSRICQEAVEIARSQGIRLGLLRPITLWPFPAKAFAEVNPDVKAYLSVELCALPKMVEDVRLASEMKAPVEIFLGGAHIPESSAIVERAVAILNAQR